MDFISDDIMTYAINHTQDESNLLKALNKETHQKILQSRMISGHFQGRVLSFISQLIRPETILEVGTYTGYATLCLAEGLTKNGKIHTIEINEELIDFQKKYFDQSKFKNQIFTHIGDAIDIIPKLKLKFDLIFLDADKANYPNYMEMVVPKLKKGGVLVADNVLWSGKVLDNQQKRDDIETKGIKLFSKLVKKQSSLQTLLLPIRDGLMMCRKV